MAEREAALQAWEKRTGQPWSMPPTLAAWESDMRIAFRDGYDAGGDEAIALLRQRGCETDTMAPCLSPAGVAIREAVASQFDDRIIAPCKTCAFLAVLDDKS